MRKKRLVRASLLAEQLKGVGDNVRALRGQKSQSTLAVMAGVSRSTVQSIESGKSIKLDNLLRIAAALEVNPAELLLFRDERSELNYKAKIILDKLFSINEKALKSGSSGRLV